MAALLGRGPEGPILQAAASGYTVTAHARGAALAALTGPDGRDLVRPTPADARRTADAGATLAPWPNRLEDGVYEFAGVTHHVPVDEPERGNALHGLVRDVEWEAVGSPDDQIVFTTRLPGEEPYPFALELRARFHVSEHGLDWSVTAVNRGDAPAPYAAAVHPYLAAGDWRAGQEHAIDAWSLRLPAAARLHVDPDRLLPRGIEPVSGTDDLRQPAPLGDREIDAAFTDFGASPAHAELTDAQGRGTRIEFATDWAQVYTDDAEGRLAVAVEPQTAPANALRGHPDLVILAPGAEHTLACRISALN